MYWAGLSLCLDGKELTCQCKRHKRHRFDPWVGKIAGERNCNPLQYSCLENPMGRGAWQATVHGVEKSWTWLSNWAWAWTCIRQLVWGTMFVLVSSGFIKKPQTGELKQQTLISDSSGGGSPRPRCQCGGILVRSLFPACRQPPSPCPRVVDRWRALVSLPLLLRTLIPQWGPHPHDFI